jgi:hypothetical protein
VPAASLAGFEEFFVIASKLAGFHEVDGKHEDAGNDRHGPAESILLTVESNWIQTKTVIWFVLFVLFFG